MRGEIDVFLALCEAVRELEEFGSCGEGAVYGPLNEDQVRRVGRAFRLLEGVLSELCTSASDDDEDEEGDDVAVA